MELVKDTNPDLRQEWAQDLNPGLSFDNLRTHSSVKVWWRCVKNPKHMWEAQVRRRTIEGNGCSYCSGLKVLREESFAAFYPKIAAEWHPTRNIGIDPWLLASHSNKRVWWQCLTQHRHEWQASVSTRVTHNSGCRQCNRIRNPLSKAFPKIAAEWHPTKNGALTPDGISAGSRKLVWWRCTTEAAHEWEASVDARTRAKTQCPGCRRASVRVKSTTLDVFDPKLAAQWHPTKNGTLRPSDVTPNTNRKVWWVCPVDSSHVWEAAIGNRAKRSAGCRFCARGSKYALMGRSLAARFPELAKEWHPTKNGTKTPADILPGSSQRVWWQCQTNPTHEWQGTVTVRTHKKSRGLCPYCSGHFVTELNSLQSKHPEIAKQWHPTKNLPLNPDTITKASARRVWWLCPVNAEHEWEASVKNRTILGSGCPHCEAENRIRRLQDILVDSANANTDPFQTFTQGLQALKALAKSSSPNTAQLKQAFHRMLYSSAITVLETYLSDAFYHRVINSDSLVERLLLTTPEFKDRKYSLSEVIDWQRATKQKVSEYLFDIVWHNLGKVRAMYSAMLGVEFPKDADPVHRAVAVRHDLVHRNGRMKNGARHRLSEDDVEAVFTEIEGFVRSIEQQLKVPVVPS